jgi:hypothetical protein
MRMNPYFMSIKICIGCDEFFRNKDYRLAISLRKDYCSLECYEKNKKMEE